MRYFYLLVSISLLFLLSGCGLISSRQTVQQPQEFTLTILDRETKTVLFKDIVNTEYDADTNTIDLKYKNGTTESIRYNDDIKIVSPYGELIIRDKVWYLIDEHGNSHTL